MEYELLEDWDVLLDDFPDEKKDIYFTKKYISLYEDRHNKALCAVCKQGSKMMLMPFIRGEVDNYYDFETAYGYGGPISNTDDLDWCNNAFRGIYVYLKENGYLCGFIRFHPLLNNQIFVPGEVDSTGEGGIQVLYDRQTIAIDTSQNIDDIWIKQISSKNRNMIRKAEKNGLVYNTDYDFKDLNLFINLYKKTMMRLEADDFYVFDNKYFNVFTEQLKSNSFLGTIKKDGRIICGALFFYSKYYGHYHLEGSDSDFSGLGANNLLLWKAACEMHRLGVRQFHLGGGTSSSKQDSLYKFKKVFSKNEKQFYIAKQIFNTTAYKSIVKLWEDANKDKIEKYGKFLLRYRY